ncbi:hypothetical protein NSA23_10545 [Anaerosalibacter massiliensis]|uniref:Uncharacterized protein n=1 Tax=Anaerosalibacter massiliensis TaxID=1347392 RepID=A0A9X2S5P4_9FIRM|nr:hypothetical protein [Anaerosalibacter massiliensis]
MSILGILASGIGAIYFAFYETINKLNSISSGVALLGMFELVNFMSSIYNNKFSN